jgi:hypothetical protein
MYQAGVKKITLYENKGIAFTFYDALNSNAITNLTSTGQVIVIENEQQPTFDISLTFSKRGRLLSDYEIKHYLYGLTKENYSALQSLTTSIFGWCFLIEFYDGTYKFYDTPIYCRESKINPHQEMSFEVVLKTAVGTSKNFYDYDPDISTVPVYRFDSTLISWDSEIISFDYEL